MIMFDRLSLWVLEVLRVPPVPAVPEASGKVRVFRAGRRYFHYRIVIWLGAQLSALAGLIAGLVFIAFLLRQFQNPAAVFFLSGFEALAWIGFVLQLPFSLAVVRLDYEQRWYILSARSLRIREGILSLREKTLTFANIQNISVQQNPLQRLLGIADLQVRTAGGGGSSQHHKREKTGESMHEAWFRGVENAEEIREIIRERVRVHRDAGLGDPDEPVAALASAPEVLLAARELRSEARLLVRELGLRRRPLVSLHAPHEVPEPLRGAEQS
jgi:uncharacterized membrane protein YdbT with pleckstrin-like domain